MKLYTKKLQQQNNKLLDYFIKRSKKEIDLHNLIKLWREKCSCECDYIISLCNQIEDILDS